MERVAKFIYSKSRLIIVLVAILNIVALASFFRFELDTDFLNLFTAGNPKAEEYDRLNEKYHIGEAISVLIEQDNSLLEEENLLSVFRLQQDIEEIDGILQVQSFIPSEISVQGYIFQVDEKFIARHSDLLEDFIEDRYFLTEQLLSSDRSKGIIIANTESDAMVRDVLKSVEVSKKLTVNGASPVVGVPVKSAVGVPQVISKASVRVAVPKSVVTMTSYRPVGLSTRLKVPTTVVSEVTVD